MTWCHLVSLPPRSPPPSNSVCPTLLGSSSPGLAAPSPPPAAPRAAGESCLSGPQLAAVPVGTAGASLGTERQGPSPMCPQHLLRGWPLVGPYQLDQGALSSPLALASAGTM